MLADPTLTGNDTITTRFNRGLFAAQARHASPDYTITEFDNYTSNITPEMRARAREGGP